MDDAPANGRKGLLAAAAVGAATTIAGRAVLSRLTGGRFGDADEYNAAKVTVSGPIRRSQGRPSPLSGPGGATADDVVEQIEAADDDEDVEALLVELNTPGGEVVPSDDIRRAAAAFDGPTVAYATDTCASGGYWIASGCDELWARDASLVGSIGVVGSRPNAKGLADKLGISYEQFTAGEYKDAGVPLKEIEEEEREYLQGIIDGYYEQFVETVSEGRDMDPEEIRETEARVYLGDDAAEIGLVDELGTEDDVEDRLAELIGAEPEVREFTPERGLAERLGIGAERVAFAAGSGVADAFVDDGGDIDVEFR
ncbi:signal peptide peptidase SppA [Halorubrum ezzemoulense]|uniref:Protease-4 n=1 Tax=Halorubrum ezzemoulense TaxID=337243 RepID=A0A256IVQ6_HALEZ|nr:MULTISPECIES: signal peptide peptidase SppA [Halorubrum]MDB2223796.1 signal peptide peptidase SppA [Halorubrum ezzemoulense]MDB2241222.1 signal peptide peptidase SppA [Halorubrum ezzemoulense]MDB2259550.1 signal peptide peptidase SppA [Halorubrum ezzemoulense]MDB2263437.1 signal peptide peptidase SppA [Halorubrum ezzemoulense]MDB2266369.1 signal peptide peptidase SppA [Halorubrum ezzemoulense]